MPHRPRVLLANYLLHIVLRGLNRELCFSPVGNAPLSPLAGRVT